MFNILHERGMFSFSFCFCGGRGGGDTLNPFSLTDAHEDPERHNVNAQLDSSVLGNASAATEHDYFLENWDLNFGFYGYENTLRSQL